MKGLFIPGITAEMFRNGCLESIEALMAEGEIYDIDYEPEQRWIPCNERLPEEKDAGILKKLGINRRSDYVLVTVDVKGERMAATACTYNGVWHWDKKYAFPNYKAIAWRALPEPYEGGKDETD